MSTAASMALIVLFCMFVALLLNLSKLILKEDPGWLRDLLSAVVVVGLMACLLAVSAFIFQPK